MTPPPWKRVTWVTSPDGVELLEAVATASGALAISTSDAGADDWIETVPGAEPPWKLVRVQALFASDLDLGALDATVARIAGASLAGTSRVEDVEDRDWVRAWMPHARPQRFGKRLWVCPTSAELPAVPEDSAVLRLDPGLGFGTGSHESTALCLEWLESQPLSGRRVLDYGCGSGILALASLLLGATDARACDIDPHALQATRDNAQRNDLEDRLWAGRPADLPDAPADILIANIMASTLIELADEFARRQESGAAIVLSGILAQQSSEVEQAYASDYVMTRWRERGGWVLLCGRHRDSVSPHLR